MNLALSEILGQGLRDAKRITQNGVIKLKLQSNEVQIINCFNSNFKLSKTCLSWITG